MMLLPALTLQLSIVMTTGMSGTMLAMICIVAKNLMEQKRSITKNKVWFASINFSVQVGARMNDQAVFCVHQRACQAYLAIYENLKMVIKVSHACRRYLTSKGAEKSSFPVQ